MSTDLEKLLALAGVSSRYPDVVLDAIQPVGTVNSRKDGDWIKTEKGWVRITKDLKATLGTVPAGKPTARPKNPSTAPQGASVLATPPAPIPAPASAMTATARAKAALKKTASVFDKHPDAKVSVGHMLAMPAPKPALPAPPAKQAVPAPAKVAVAAPAEDPEAKRAAVAAKIKPLLLKALKSLGDGGSDDDVEIHGNSMTASYRTWNLPKDHPSDPSDYDDEGDGDDGMNYYDYEEKVSEELKNARAKVTAALAGHMDSISTIWASVGDKNYVEIDVELK
jgi:hypothetical protein